MARFALSKPSLSKQVFETALKKVITVSFAVLLLALLLHNLPRQSPKKSRLDPALGYLPPLEMKGGDPYIRALMRTISASEANDPKPYSILYGGRQIDDLSRHPEQCMAIISGPYSGDCSTAAGRYQMLNITWKEKAKLYHPQPPGIMFWKPYSFEPEFQDAVVYAWLSDHQFWGADLSKLLKQGKLNQVRRILSGTWTSLGYGIENNSLTGRLPKVYQKMLKEELKKAA